MGRCYPDSLAATKWLAFHARRVPAVGVNTTYRSVPGPQVFERWRDAAPGGFRSSVEAPRVVARHKRLAGAQDETSGFLARLDPLLARDRGARTARRRVRAHRDDSPDGDASAGSRVASRRRHPFACSAARRA